MTDKEVAEKLRYVAEYNLSNTHLIDLADELDPPGPEIPDGHIWYRYIGATPQEWSPALKRVDKVFNQYGRQLLPDSRLEIIPARTLKPRQVAVDIPPITEWPEKAVYMALTWYREGMIEPLPYRNPYRTIINRAEAKQLYLDRDTEA